MNDALIELDKRLQQLERKIGNIVQYGIVLSVNYVYATAIIDFKNGCISPSLPFMQQPNSWNPIKEGDQVVVIAPNGVMQHGFVVPHIYQTGIIPDIAPDSFVVKFDYGKIVCKNGIITINAKSKIVVQNDDKDSIVCGDGIVTVDASKKIILQNKIDDNTMDSITCEEGVITIDASNKIILQNKIDDNTMNTITCENGTIILNSSAKVILQDETGGGVVCQNHLCSFTGSPHPQGSSKIKGAL